MKPTAIEAELDDLALNRPEEWNRLLAGYFNLLGEGEPENLTLAAIPMTARDDPRQYNVGLPMLTTQMAPFLPGELVVIGAREGHGKTAYAELIALRNSIEYKVLFATLEMTPEEIRDRMLAKIMRTPVAGVHYARAENTADYRFAVSTLNSHEGLYIWHPAKNEQRTIEALTQRAAALGADLMVIDYGREITGWEAGKPSAEIVNRLGKFVRSSRITTVLLSQLNRDAVAKKPHNGHLQDTGRLEQRADRVILLHRPYLGIPRMDRICEITITKNRQGSCFRWHAHWEPGSMNYFDMTDEESANAACCRKRNTRQA
jgi:replicative DNA helicase